MALEPEDVMRDILIVEDTPEHVKIIKSVLPGAWRLHVAGTMEAAMNMLETIEVDCAVLDLVLPDAKGLQVIEHVRGAYPDLAIVAISNQDEEIGIDALHVGAQDFLMKAELSQGTLRRSIQLSIDRAARVKEQHDLAERIGSLWSIIEELKDQYAK